MNKKQIEKFQRKVYQCFKENKRNLPWRRTTSPYKILVSEIMLQQTQVDRVIPKYKQFVKKFPTTATLARAQQATVLKYWSGLGYNRRAINLHKTARIIHQEYKDKIPQTITALTQLPGIGLPTATAIITYVYNKPHPYIETNIRTVFLHHFFANEKNIYDRELIPLVQQTLDTKNPRQWYTALMDYGSFLKKTYGNPNNKSKHYTKQTRFKGSNRQKRGAVLKYLIKHKKAGLKTLSVNLYLTKKEMKSVLNQLEREKFIVNRNQIYALVR